MGGRRLILLFVALLGSGAFDRAAAAGLEGTYSNVCLSPDTGDQGGVEVTLVSSSAGPSVIFKICEGGCWQPETHDVEIVGRRIAFTVTDTTFDNGGHAVETARHRFQGVFDARTLSLESPGYYERFQLRRVRHPDHVMQKVLGDADLSTWPTPQRRCR